MTTQTFSEYLLGEKTTTPQTNKKHCRPTHTHTPTVLTSNSAVQFSHLNEFSDCQPIYLKLFLILWHKISKHLNIVIQL